MTCSQNLSMSFSLRCRWRKFCLTFVKKNPQKELQTGSPNGFHCRWLKDYTGDRRQSLVDSGRESWIMSDVCVLCCDNQCTRDINPGASGAGAPIVCTKGPSVDRAPIDYAAACHKVSNTLRTLRGPPYRGDRLLMRLFLWTVLVFLWTDEFPVLWAWAPSKPEIFQLCWQRRHVCISVSIYHEGF